MKSTTDGPRAELAVTVTLLAALVAVGMFCGCADLMAAFMGGETPPNGRTAPYDETGDGVADIDVYTNADGEPLIEPATGQPAEVPGSREKYAAGMQADTAIGTLLQVAGTLGLPLAGGAGLLWGRKKPIQRLTALWTQFCGLVRSVNEVRHTAETGGAVTAGQIDALLREFNALTPQLEAAIAEAKGTLAGTGGTTPLITPGNPPAEA